MSSLKITIYYIFKYEWIYIFMHVYVMYERWGSV